MPCGSCKNGSFGGTQCLHHQDDNPWSRNSSQHTSDWQLLLKLFLAHRFLSAWWLRRYVPPTCRFLQEPHGVTTKKTPFLKSVDRRHVIFPYDVLDRNKVLENKFSSLGSACQYLFRALEPLYATKQQRITLNMLTSIVLYTNLMERYITWESLKHSDG
jgi:hypothetical protein